MGRWRLSEVEIASAKRHRIGGHEVRIVVIASRKGGSGKTTLAGHLAVEAESQGAGPVGLMDMDPQGSLADWWNARADESPLFIQTTIQDFAGDIGELKDRRLSLLIVDTPPALTATLARIMAYADLVLIPTRPSPHDLRSIGGTVDLAEDLGKRFAFVVNGAAARARITRDTIRLLSEHGPVAPAVIHHRVDFAVGMIDGRTVMELPGQSRSSEEVGAIWHFMREQLDRVASIEHSAAEVGLCAKDPALDRAGGAAGLELGSASLAV